VGRAQGVVVNTDVLGCLACDLTHGRRPLPGGLVHATPSWRVEHCVGPLGVGTLLIKPLRHVESVGAMSEEESAELGPLLVRTADAVQRLTAPEQVYVGLWSHAGRAPGHVHFVVQPATSEAIDTHGGAYGPALQAAMFEADELPEKATVEKFAASARALLRPSLYDYAGGATAMLRLAQAHHERCVADPVLNHPFSHPGQHPQHVERLAAYWGEVLGGPREYSQSCAGDQSTLLAMHSGNGDLGDLPQRFVACFVAAMDDVGLPAETEFRAAMRGYMQWAVSEFDAYPDDPAAVPVGLTVPRWSWDGPH
jgi:hemoglobin